MDGHRKNIKMKVITYQNTNTGQPSTLCDEHEHVAGSYVQITHGQHRGSCDECTRLATEIVAIKDGEMICATCAIAHVSDQTGEPYYTVNGELSEFEWYGTFKAGDLSPDHKCASCDKSLDA